MSADEIVKMIAGIIVLLMVGAVIGAMIEKRISKCEEICSYEDIITHEKDAQKNQKIL